MDSEGSAYDELVSQMLAQDDTIAQLIEVQERLLEWSDEPEARQALLGVWASTSWSRRRALMARLGAPEQVVLIPELARLTPELDASGQRDVVGVLGRMESVAAEPILIHVLDTSSTPTRAAAADVLARVGTRQSVMSLRGALDGVQDPVFEASLLNALDMIEQRFPVHANQGSLTLAEGGVEGALTLAGASAGEVTLYEHAAEEFERAQGDARGTSRALTVNRVTGALARWQGLAPSPREVDSSLMALAYVGDPTTVKASVAGLLIVTVASASSLAFPLFEDNVAVMAALALVSVASMFATMFVVVSVPLFVIIRWQKSHEALVRYASEGAFATLHQRGDEDARVIEYVDAGGQLRQVESTEALEEAFEEAAEVNALLNDGEVLLLSRWDGLVPTEDGRVTADLSRPGIRARAAATGAVLAPMLVYWVWWLFA